MALRQRRPQDPHEFPGGEGKHLMVRTNLFDMTFTRPLSIGMYEVVGSKKNRDNWDVLPPLKAFQQFKNIHARELQGHNVIEGYPTENGVTIYIIPSHRLDLFPMMDARVPEERQGRQFINIYRAAAEFRGNIDANDWNNFDNELRRFFKRAAFQSIAQLFEHHDFTLMKRSIYTFERNRQHARFPMRPLNDIFNLVSGFKIGFETNVPWENGTSRNMVAIDLTQTVCTRTHIPLFQCYVELYSLSIHTNPILNPGDLAGQMLNQGSVSSLNGIFANCDVYIRGEGERNGRPVLYKFVEILNKPATYYKSFDKRTNSQVGIILLLERQFGIRIEYPTLNAVKLRKGKNEKYVPLELVYLSDRPQKIAVCALHILTELNRQVKEHAAIVPRPRWEWIESIAGRLNADLMDSDDSNLLKSVGIQINDKPIDVMARVLDQPLDTYSQFPGTLAIPCKVAVDYVIVDLRLRNPRNVSPQSVSKDVDILMDKLYNLGIYMAGKRSLHYFEMPRNSFDGSRACLEDVVDWHLNVGLTQYESKMLYIVVVAERNDDLYKLIKQKLDFNAILNQVITIDVLQNVKQHDEYRRDLRDVAEDFTFNIALNINAKLGGINCMPLDDPMNLWNEDINDNELVMFIGIDTRLGSQKNTLGIVGITTSIDNKGTRYNAFAIITDGVNKYCSDYKNILYHAFDAYEGPDGRRGQFPTKIIVFRAGMSEYDLVKKEGLLEYKHILNVCRRYMDEKGFRYMPKLTYIGYHRSHGIRFYDVEQDDKIPRLRSDIDLEGVKANVPPGTVIDHAITNPNCFYFVSHETFMGTTKPAKYTIVMDENCFKADNLLAIVYQLCRLMPQTKRSYRRPVPIGLAGKLLERCILVKPTLFNEMGKGEQFYINPENVDRLFYI